MLEAVGHWNDGLRPDASSYGALVFGNACLQAQIALFVAAMGAFAGARALAGKLDATRRIVFDNCALLWLYAIGQSAFGLMLVHGFPRMVA